MKTNPKALWTSNFYYNLPKIEDKGYILKDISFMDLLPKLDESILKDLNVSFDYYRITDDEMIDVISNKLYNSPKYWDLLMVINGVNSIDDLPKNNDILIFRAQKRLLEENDLNLMRGIYLSPDKEKELYLKILEEVEFENEKFRNILYPKKGDLGIVINYYNKNLGKNTLNENLIIK